MVYTMAERLTELRKKRKLSQTDVANRMGVTSALISAYENNERKPSIDKLSALADIYNTSTDYILGRTTSNDNGKCYIDVTNLKPNQLKAIRKLVDVMNEDNSPPLH